MREFLKSGYFLVQKLLGRERALYERVRREDLVTILNFHQVSPHSNPYWPPLHPDEFDALLGFLKHRFTIVTIAEINDAPRDRPVAVISFDDGYYNFIEYAAPILAKHKLRANMNVIPNCALTGEPMWNIRLYDFLGSAPKSLIDEIDLPGFDERLASENYAAKLNFGLKISRFLKNRPRSERIDLLAGIEPLYRSLEAVGTRMMSVTEIRGIASEHELGAHSWSHESMEFESDEFFRDDVVKCKDFFENELEQSLGIYAFPNGSYRPEQIEILRSNSVKYSLLVGEDHGRRDATVFPRFTIYGSGTLENRFQALGFNRSRTRDA